MIEVQAQEYLNSKDIRPSIHRIAIMKYLLEHSTHPTVDDIFNDLHEEIPTLSKTTIYNTLKLFSEKNAALVLNIEEKNVHFDGDTHPHNHFRCIKCGKIFDLPLNENINFANEQYNGFEVIDTQVYHKGFCPKCKENNN